MTDANHHGASPDDFDGSAKHTGRLRTIAIVFVALALAAAVGVFLWRNSIKLELQHARQAALRGSWQNAINHLNRYLHHHPSADEARLLIAEAYIRSSEGDFNRRVNRAIFHLQQINADSDLAAEARLQEGRLSLFLLKKPATAERLLKASLHLNPKSAEANRLMWQLLDVTGRHFLSDPYFWQAYTASPPSAHGQLLKDWFFSEFYPEDLHAKLFEQMGVSSVGKIPASVNLLVHFREVEPEAPCLHAALAQYYHDLGNLNATMDLLKECPDVATAMTDPFFVSVLFEALIDLGEFQKAVECFAEFPQPHEGFIFWRSESMFYDYIHSDDTAAVQSLRKAHSTPPGKFDWGLMTRLSVCLRKIGEVDEAKEIQTQVDYLTREVLTAEYTSALRNSLHDLQNPETATKLIEFYGKFGLKREVQAWNDYKYSLTLSAP